MSKDKSKKGAAIEHIAEPSQKVSNLKKLLKDKSSLRKSFLLQTILQSRSKIFD